jgi:hypothetical protein
MNCRALSNLDIFYHDNPLLQQFSIFVEGKDAQKRIHGVAVVK